MTRQVARSAPTLGDVTLAEACGTFLLVFFGCGAVHAAVLRDAQSGVWQVAVVWGVAIMLAIFAVGAVSGAHLNPAITLALAVWGRHPWNRVVPYVVAQTVGAFVAAAVLFLLFAGFLAAKERAKGVVRGEPGSVVTAMCYGEYYPNPAPFAAAPGPFDQAAFEASQRQFGHAAACSAEFLGTLVLGWMAFALADPRNSGGPPAQLAPVFIGLTVAALISVLAPLTQACFNPARDFGPRLFAWWAGWGRVALPGLDGVSWLTVYILSPAAGAAAGGGLYEILFRRVLPAAADAT